MEFGLQGPAFTVSSPFASSAHAIVQAAGLIRDDEVDVALAGGADAIATYGCMRAWEAVGAISPTGCRPFSADRDGTAIGDRAGVLVLEERVFAERRGAPILAELIGGGLSSDATHITQPARRGPIASLRKALRSAPKDATYLISAHGTGAPRNDANEAGALRETIGDLAPHRIIATKSSHGHLLGATAAVQTIIGIAALRTGKAPPILGHVAGDPACADLPLVTGTAQPISADHLIVNAFGFGGLNATMLFARG
jgi:nodulation protein E